jgi:hypothetical protein
MSRYVGLFALLLSMLLLVNFASDFLYARAIAAQTDEDDEAIPVATAASPDRLPLTGLVRAPTGRWGQGRMIGVSDRPVVQSAESCINPNPVASVQR